MSPREVVARIVKVTGSADTALGWCLSSPDGQLVSDEDIAAAERADLVRVDRRTYSVGPVAFLTDAGAQLASVSP